MVFTPTTWVSGGAPGISAAELNRIEAGVLETSYGIKGIGSPQPVTTLPVAYQDRMVTIETASVDQNWPFWSTALTFRVNMDSYYTVQLLLGAISDDLAWRRNNGPSAWGPWGYILHTKTPVDFNFPNVDLIFGSDTSEIKWNTDAPGAWVRRISLATFGATFGVNTNDPAQDIYFSSPGGVTFLEWGYTSPKLQVRMDVEGGPSSGKNPVLMWSSVLGYRSIYFGGYSTPDYSRGIAPATLFDKVGQYYRLYTSTQDPQKTTGLNTPKFEIDTGPVVPNLKAAGYTIPKMAIGKYTGSGIALGQKITVGFTPKHVVIHQVGSLGTGIWHISGDPIVHPYTDTASRNTGITSTYGLSPIISTTLLAIIANGFKVGAGNDVTPGGNDFDANTYGTIYSWIAYG